MPRKPTNESLTKARIEAWEKDRIAAAERAGKGAGEPPPDPKVYADGEIPGLALICFLSGTMTWSLYYRTRDHRPRRLKVGRYPDLSIKEAREEARGYLSRRDKGGDPVADLEAQRLAAKAALTVAQYCDEYEATHLPSLRKSTQTDYRGMLRKYVRPELGSKRLQDVSGSDVRKLREKVAPKNIKKKGESTSMATGGHRRANMVVNLLRGMYNTAIKAKYCTENPAVGIERFPEHARSRYLSDDEIARLMAVLDQRVDAAADAVRLALLTGSRRGEILGATWGQFDLDATPPTWVNPHTMTKQARDHRIPLSSSAVAILRTMRARADKGTTHLFPGSKGAPQRGLKTAWATIRKKAGIPDVRLHDLRHSFASLLASSGASLLVVGSMLGHTQVQTTARYAHLYSKVMEEAAETVGTAIDAAVASGTKPRIQEAA